MTQYNPPRAFNPPMQSVLVGEYYCVEHYHPAYGRRVGFYRSEELAAFSIAPRCASVGRRGDVPSVTAYRVTPAWPAVTDLREFDQVVVSKHVESARRSVGHAVGLARRCPAGTERCTRFNRGLRSYELPHENCTLCGGSRLVFRKAPRTAQGQMRAWVAVCAARGDFTERPRLLEHRKIATHAVYDDGYDGPQVVTLAQRPPATHILVTVVAEAVSCSVLWAALNNLRSVEACTDAHAQATREAAEAAARRKAVVEARQTLRELTEVLGLVQLL